MEAYSLAFLCPMKGSVTLGFMRRAVGLPLIVATLNSHNAPVRAKANLTLS